MFSQPLSSTLVTALLGISFAAPRAHAFNPGFLYGTSKVRGVNLGGWLVLEPWITPSLFENTGNPGIVDEWTFGQYQSQAAATAALTAHWDTWIVEQDFIDIANAGLNHVRIPIGFWAFDVSGGEPYIQGQVSYLNKAVQWAGAHGLKVIVDLHGAPGSQNGFDNSGHRISYPQWQTSQSNIDRTNNIVKTLINMFQDQTSVVPIIEPLNEPAGYYPDVLDAAREYYANSYGNVRYPFGNAQQSNTVVMIQDAFQPLSYWNGFETPTGSDGVAMDTHIYQVFSDDGVAMSQAQHIAAACGTQSSISAFNTNELWTIVGEWSPASTDCAPALNGRGLGARYDGSLAGSAYVGSCAGMSGSGAGFSGAYKTFLRQFWEAQVIAYEKGAGWIMWTWKAENADEWSYQAGLRYGWIPQVPTNLQYPNICG